jgi:hypothetical protein
MTQGSPAKIYRNSCSSMASTARRATSSSLLLLIGPPRMTTPLLNQPIEELSMFVPAWLVADSAVVQPARSLRSGHCEPGHGSFSQRQRTATMFRVRASPGVA